MKALSLWQPWATLLASGMKEYETRGWQTYHRGPIAIHAAQKWDGELEALTRTEPFYSTLLLLNAGGRPPLQLHRGSIVGYAFLERVDPTEVLMKSRALLTKRERAFGNFEPGRFGWRMSDAVLIEPVWCRGRQGLFTLDERTAAQVRERVRAAKDRQRTLRMRAP
ncbi:MAG TPA: hypothetical protein VD838_05900 [Anaeromyxobacteraceae bacterium]|nr:hypothetical protein [Anaeromyxobacteraceae bacterium]